MTQHYDVIIIGAGIAGLWLSNILKRQGFNIILLEKDCAGGGETLAAHGMIAGAHKVKAKLMTPLTAMPARWEACLGGFGEIDLTAVKVLSETQVMWPAAPALGAPALLAAAKQAHGAPKKLKNKHYPAALAMDETFKGPVYEWPAKVIDMKSLVSALAAPLAGRLLRGTATEVMPDGQVAVRAPDGSDHVLSAQLVVFTAGVGNEDAFRMLNLNKKMAQRQPLRQLMVQGLPEPLYGHGVAANVNDVAVNINGVAANINGAAANINGAAANINSAAVDAKPRLTVTSSRMTYDVTGTEYGEYIWCIGGGIAEAAAAMSESDAIAFAQKELQKVFPAISWRNRLWATWTGARAEPFDADGTRPAGPAVQQRGKILIAWPAQLTYAPALADRISAFMQARNVMPAAKSPPPALPPAPVGHLPWEAATWTRL